MSAIPLPPARSASMEEWPEHAPVPDGVILIHPTQLVWIGAYWDGPCYYLVDTIGRCKDCRERFFFSAREQHFWYRTLKIPASIGAVRCKPCRRRVRAVKGTQKRLVNARRATKATPEDSAALLELSRALAGLYELSGKGSLDDAIAAARQVRRAKQSSKEEKFSAVMLEAQAQALAGRVARAKTLLTELLAESGLSSDAIEDARRALTSLSVEA